MGLILLVTRPRHDYTTRYISKWAEKVIELAKQKGLPVLDLQGERANKDECESMLKKQNPLLVFFNGHGSERSLTGHDNEPILEAGKNSSLLAKKVTYALSCRTATALGPVAVEEGALAFIGYRQNFIFVFSVEKRTKPHEDDIADLFLTPSNLVMISILKGNTVRDACDNARAAYGRNIRGLLTSQTSEDSTQLIRYLLWDMQNLTHHGDGDAACIDS